MVDRTWETVDKIVLGGGRKETVDEDLHGQLEGDQAALAHDLADLVAIASALKNNGLISDDENEGMDPLLNLNLFKA